MDPHQNVIDPQHCISVSRMFGTDTAFNPDLLSGRLEEILPTIQQVIVLIITAVGLLGVRLLVGDVYSTHRPCCGTGTAETATFFP
jgi:hypothetical protein